MQEQELSDLLQKARTKNESLDITGMLLYLGGNFLQVIEGAEQDVKSLFADIQNDMRHTGIITLEEGAVEQRTFTGWSMGFRLMSMAELNEVPGYANVTEKDFLTNVANTESYALDMLHTFRENMETRLS